jgi:exodeoxyribonuclease VII large subunit
MSQLPLFQPPSWTVGDLTRYLRQALESDPNLQGVWVAGEVSNCSRPSSGHLYFTLKDSTASLRCVMWRNGVIRQSFIPRDGDAIEVHGSIGIYESSGVYQLYADQILPTGEGILFKEFIRLKARLEAEGLFATERKRPIPRWPRRIGLVTSPSGAALRDVLNTIRRRCSASEVIVAPTAVQGEEAPTGIVAAMAKLERFASPDVILLTRGGGSLEDLWAFNDERVVRAIVNCSVPVISGVGHETDFTIADFAADLRAPTPTAAAELATPDQEDMRAELIDLIQRLRINLRSALAEPRWYLSSVQKRLQVHSPHLRLRSNRQRLDDVLRRMEVAAGYCLALRKTSLKGLEQKLIALDPQGVLNRGFAILTKLDGSLVHSIRQAQEGEKMNVRVSDGGFEVRVEKEELKDE